jgi:hypothetical protein
MLPPGLDLLVLRALAPSQDKRYPDCGALRLALEEYIIQLRMPASTAHLSAFLRELYADRIALEADPSKLDQLAEDADLDSKEKTNPSRSRSGIPGQQPATPSRSLLPSVGASKSRSRQDLDALVGPAKRQEPTRATEAMSPPAHRRRFPAVAVAVSAAVTLVIAGAAVVLLRKAPDPLPPPPPVATPAPEPVQVVDPQPAPTAPVPMQVELVLSSEPAGAAVHVAGQAQPMGVTPVTLPLKPDDPPLSVTLSLDGYEPKTQQISAANAPALLVALERRAPPGKNPGGKRTPPGGSLGIKKGR